ncbi:MAG: 3-hydroxyacyl-CoA dehydrogenase family protein [Dethiosulfatibacter sp.]|nr:3-hydroxyacyl-CoA dehydrogenase family protein [Dethiosulfatibacter sp.]
MFRNVGVVGAGTMGHGIALAYAKAGVNVTIVDLTEDILNRALEKMSHNLDIFVEEGMLKISKEEVLRNITFSTENKDLKDCEFIIETIIENLEIKQKLFKELDELCGPHTILASNTSSLRLSEIVRDVKRKDKVILTHFFNPAHIIPLVELLKHSETSDDTYESVKSFYEECGKETILVNKELPGLVANRIQIAMAREVFSLLDQQVASAQDIDKAITAGPGFRLSISGAIEIADLGGLDVWNTVSKYLVQFIDSSREPFKSLVAKVEKGEYGAKNGKGFYEYSGQGLDDIMLKRDKKLVKQLKFMDQIKQ